MKREAAAVAVCAWAALLVLTAAQPSCADDDADVAVYVAAVRAHLDLVQGGDVVLVHPPWRDDVVAAVRALADSGALPPGVTVTEAFAPTAKGGAGADWPPLVVVADRRWPLPAALRRRAGEETGNDDVTVLRLAALPRPRLLDVRSATVRVVGPGDAVVACPWSPARRRHVCAGLPEWMTVGDDTLAIGGAPTACTWAHPRTDAVVVVDFGSVELAATDGRLRLSLALSDTAADNPTGAPVTAKLIVGDDEKTVTVQRQRGFVDVDIELGAGLGAGRRTPVRVELTTPHDGQRHTCFRLTTMPTMPTTTTTTTTTAPTTTTKTVQP